MGDVSGPASEVDHAARATYYLQRAREDLNRAAESLTNVPRAWRYALDAKTQDLADSVASVLEELES